MGAEKTWRNSFRSGKLDPTRTRFLSRFKTSQVISPMAAPEDNCSAFAAVSFQLDASASCRSMAFHLPGLIQYDYDVSLPFKAHLGPACHRDSAVPPSLFVCSRLFSLEALIYFCLGWLPSINIFWLLRTVSSHFCPYICLSTNNLNHCLPQNVVFHQVLSCNVRHWVFFIYVLLIEEIQLIWRSMAACLWQL